MPENVKDAYVWMKEQFDNFIDRCKNDITVKDAKLELEVHFREGTKSITEMYKLKYHFNRTPKGDVVITIELRTPEGKIITIGKEV
jgi:sporulation-control protein spo0M